ncbi:hypothetical protein ACUOGF_23065, partial [Escherichia coli]
MVFPLVGGLAALAFFVGAPEDTFTAALNAAVILSVSFMMFSFVDNIVTLEKLRTAQEQVAALAAERERSRVA